MPDDSARSFYDALAADYDLLFADWDASISRQGRALDRLLVRQLGDARRGVLDCACGIGTQAIGLGAHGHRVVGSDLSTAAVTRARAEASQRRIEVPVLAADMRRLPFSSGSFEVVLCADNAIAHLLTETSLAAALHEMRRVLAPGGLLVLTVRSDHARDTHPAHTPPQVTDTHAGRVITFQLWDWHADGEHYDMQHIQLHPRGGTYEVRVRRTSSWALRQEQLSSLVLAAGFLDLCWHLPDASGFPQPVLTARRT